MVALQIVSPKTQRLTVHATVRYLWHHRLGNSHDRSHDLWLLYYFQFATYIILNLSVSDIGCIWCFFRYTEDNRHAVLKDHSYLVLHTWFLCGVRLWWGVVKSGREFHNPLGLAKKNAQHDLRRNNIPPAHERYSTCAQTTFHFILDEPRARRLGSGMSYVRRWNPFLRRSCWAFFSLPDQVDCGILYWIFTTHHQRLLPH